MGNRTKIYSLSRRRFLTGAAAISAVSAFSLARPRPAQATQIRPGRPSAVVEPPTTANIVYGTVEGVDLLADLYAPSNGARSPWPWVMYIHGGGWSSGDKVEVAQSDKPMSPTLLALQAAGFAVVSINYRLYPDYVWPAMIEDSKLAVRSFRANATTYGLDPNRLGVWGSSAGAHLAQLCGFADSSAGWDVGAYLTESSTPEVVASWYGPFDLSTLYLEAEQKGSNNVILAISTIFGTSTLAQLAASPVTYASAGDPPIGFWQGQDDTTVFPDQMTEGETKCGQLGIPYEGTLVLNAGHEFTQVGPKPISPSLSQIAQEVATWVQEYI